MLSCFLLFNFPVATTQYLIEYLAIAIYYQPSFLFLKFLVTNNLGKAISCERSATHKGAIDIRHGHELLDIVSVHRSSVLNDDLLSNLLAILLGDERANEMMDFLSNLLRADQSSANGPDRFI